MVVGELRRDAELTTLSRSYIEAQRDLAELSLAVDGQVGAVFHDPARNELVNGSASAGAPSSVAALDKLDRQATMRLVLRDVAPGV